MNNKVQDKSLSVERGRGQYVLRRWCEEKAMFISATEHCENFTSEASNR